MHPEVFKFELHLSDHIIRTEILGKLCGKQLVVRENQMVFTIQDHRLKPFQGETPEIRENIIDLMRIRPECPWAIKEVELALDEEAFELLCI